MEARWQFRGLAHDDALLTKARSPGRRDSKILKSTPLHRTLEFFVVEEIRLFDVAAGDSIWGDSRHVS